MDVLDHSCSKLGFGGKMCVDWYREIYEEKEEDYHWSYVNAQFSMEILLHDFPR
jgi:4-hydroxy-3-polyprenylbenzoate decarboxylase